MKRVVFLMQFKSKALQGQGSESLVMGLAQAAHSTKMTKCHPNGCIILRQSYVTKLQSFSCSIILHGLAEDGGNLLLFYVSSESPRTCNEGVFWIFARSEAMDGALVIIQTRAFGTWSLIPKAFRLQEELRRNLRLKEKQLKVHLGEMGFSR